MEPSVKGLDCGQPVYFVGFPFWLHCDRELIDRGYPLPFVKTGIVGAKQLNDRLNKQTSYFYIDGYGIEGFSGGPVIYKQNERDETYKVAGVVSKIIDSQEKLPIFNNTNKEEKSVLYRENLGIVKAIDIQHAIDLIKEKPIGYKLVPN